MIEDGAEIDALIVSGNSVVDMYATSLDTVVITGSDAVVRFRSQTMASSGSVVVNQGRLTVDKTNPVIATSGSLYISDGGVLDFDSTENLALASSGTIDLVNKGMLDTRDVQVFTSPGTITSYNGRIRPFGPVTMAVQSDTKLSSTDFRSLNFSSTRNSGHIPTVLW